VSTCQRCAVGNGNEVQRAALTPNAGLWEYRERREVHAFSAAMYGAAQHRLSQIAEQVDVDGLASALVHPEIGVLVFDDQFPQSYSQVGLLSAVRLSRSWEEGLWHAS
jgi:hypothetical protein